MLADRVKVSEPDLRELVKNIKEFSVGKMALKKSFKRPDPDNRMSFILNLIDPYLKRFK